ncbi:histone-like nucleoid-structuring protein Lsr2 [Dietzia natronolimnaea]|uniref:histone-like nucleoid-structuring protein Lsr2 n=1 Tax=Dietzia natronolimnaea TaxID=161920 RepID=UPI0015FC3AA0|nr:Lsr2 family protein [Dietzia natronolimnaea]MBB1037415.1 Lsr2 family protein [Dietzia natronolimnaea]
MAEKVIRILVDDISGQEIADGEGRRVTFGFEGSTYQLDLTDEHLQELQDAIDPYIQAGTRVSSGSKPRQRAVSGSGRRSEELQAIRDWANENGYDVAPRGRIKREVIEAYEANKS